MNLSIIALLKKHMKSLNKIIVFLFSCFLMASCCCFSNHRRSADAFKNIILIGWDGAQRSRLKDILKDGDLPNLKLLIQEGSLLDLDVTTGDTSTKAGWAEILTGYSCGITGVYNNREKYKPIPRGYTIFERLKDYFGDKNIVTVFLAGKKHNLGARGPHKIWPKGPRGIWWNEAAWDKWQPKNEELLHMGGEPYMITKAYVDFFENGLGKAQQVGSRAIEYIRRFMDNRFFIFVHFGEPDELGHAYGEGSIGYAKGLIMNDTWLGKIVDALKKLKLYDTTLIYVVSDHGFTQNSKEHDYAPETFLATNDPYLKKKRADRKDITPTILRRYGLQIAEIKPSLEGHSLY